MSSLLFKGKTGNDLSANIGKTSSEIGGPKAGNGYSLMNVCRGCHLNVIDNPVAHLTLEGGVATFADRRGRGLTINHTAASLYRHRLLPSKSSSEVSLCHKFFQSRRLISRILLDVRHSIRI